MKTIRHLFSSISNAWADLFPRVVTLDNEGTFDAVATIDNANPGVLRVPYGQFPKGDLVQEVNKQSASNMARMMAGGETTWEWAKRVLLDGFTDLWGKAAPVVIGHPKNTAGAPCYAKVNKIVALDNEMELHTDWKPEGLKLVTGDSPRFIKFSPRFKAQVRGKKAFPFAIEHVGLTNCPVIPVPDIGSIDNAEEEGVDEAFEAVCSVNFDNGPDSEDGMCAVPTEPLRSVREKLNLDPDATMEQVEAALKQHGAMIDDHKAAATKHAADHAALKDQFEAEKAKVTKLDNELTVSKNATTALRRTLVDKTLRALQQSGRVKASDFTSTLERLVTLDNEAALATELDKLAALPGAPVVSRMSGASVGARIGTLDNERNAASRATEHAMEAVKAEQKRLEASGLPSDQAYTRAYATVMN